MEVDDKTRDMFGLPELPSIARRNDPKTSKQAASNYEQSGKRVTDRQRMLAMCETYPGRTAGEYAELFKAHGMHWYKAANFPRRRLAELVDTGDIRQGKPRECAVTKAEATIYYTTR